MEDLPSFEANMVKKEDLFDRLMDQLSGLRMNDAERRISELIIGNLDDDGYLKLPDVDGDPLIRLCNEADVPMAVGSKMLRKIQHLDPVGCGARDLLECLMIQVQAMKEPAAQLLQVMIKKHMKLLESKNLPAIARDLKVTLDEVITASKLLQKLDPKPGRNYSGEEAQHITPDVFVHKVGEEYHVVLNDDGLSKLRVSDAYRRALRNGALNPKQKEFVQEKMRSAQWLLRSIQQRQRTIHKVTESIVKFQRDFFDKGIAHLKPLILRDVAEDIEMHESTVSRVTTAKYVHTPQGIFELKYFFNSSIARTGGDDIASEAVKNHIKQLVGTENPKNPYSDQKIVELLKAQGIEIARRTVAKYREVLGVLPSSKRKKYF
jgi:RNA polymerase sigma-54 factor